MLKCLNHDLGCDYQDINKKNMIIHFTSDCNYQECENRELGCKWFGNLKERGDHDCLFEIIECKYFNYGCDYKGFGEGVKEHENTCHYEYLMSNFEKIIQLKKFYNVSLKEKTIQDLQVLNEEIKNLNTIVREKEKILSDFKEEMNETITQNETQLNDLLNEKQFLEMQLYNFGIENQLNKLSINNYLIYSHMIRSSSQNGKVEEKVENEEEEKELSFGYWTLDPSLCGNQLNLSDDLLTLTKNMKGHKERAVLGNKEFSSGIEYWKLNISSLEGKHFWVFFGVISKDKFSQTSNNYREGYGWATTGYKCSGDNSWKKDDIYINNMFSGEGEVYLELNCEVNPAILTCRFKKKFTNELVKIVLSNIQLPVYPVLYMNRISNIVTIEPGVQID
eukprot:TRINITY_DN8883_c0_g2_i1.p1 TRINITY_DN8883_c0_g2~~TRINITY_DN8883_c0_g2_i1.p1  ORF type:complete len:392 (+),score=87.68 TRINITY_DN8883_c0_g2_i1:88-1263(+)